MDAPLSVKRFLEQVKAKVEPGFAACCLVGEVSNARTSGRHWYFTLKEEGAALSCAVWSSQQRFLKATPKDGQRVVVKGSLGLYVPGGSLTFAVTHLEAAGTGDLQQRLRELEAALRAEGLFERPKRSLPRVPRRLGVVAALGGAALRDVLEVAGRRAPGLPILVAPAAAQGDRCVPEVLAALRGSGRSLADYTRDCPSYPQILLNVRVAKGFKTDGHAGVAQAVAEVEAELGETGRVVLRPSGTEPLIRVMVEGRDEAQVRRTAEHIAGAVRTAAGM